jgi:soluble lytic murein transglycosylase-like protein
MTLASCVLFWSFMNGIDPAITKAVIKVESNGNPLAVGQGKDFGLMQVRQKFVPYSKLQLLNSCTNVMIGTQLLAKAKASCKKCIDKTWINAYNLGHSGAKKLKYPRKFAYYRKIAAVLGEK